MAMLASFDSKIQPDQFLITKLHLPRTRTNLVPRPRLTTRLNLGLEHKLILISAPAGFGKTTLLCEWIHQLNASPEGQGLKNEKKNFHPTRVAWLSLDEGDNDPTRFWLYAIAALQSWSAGLDESTLARLHVSQSLPLESILTQLLNELAAWPGHFFLVLDDYHLIQTPTIHHALTFWLDHLPPQMHLVLTSRSDPPLPLARLRARDQLIEIRADDLRFTPTEAAAFLQQVMGLSLSGDEAVTLGERTEGWVVGLQMAALSLQGRTDITHFINSFTGSHRYIVDYLMDEVLQQQPKNIEEFLLKTSILNHLSSSLCDAVIGQEEENPSSFILEKLERANLFLIPLDDERRWYRYHHLFAEALSHRLQNLHPEQLSSLHQRASVWHEQHGLIAEAIHHALSTPDFERAAYLVGQVGQTLLMRSEITTLLKWLNALPQAIIQKRPQLCIFHAWTLILNGQVAEAEQRLQEASTVEAAPDILGRVATIRALIVLFRGDIRHAGELTQQAQALLPADDPFLPGIIALNQGIPYFLNGDVEAATQAFAEVMGVSRKSGNITIAVIIGCQIAEAQIAQGRLHQALATYQQVLELATTPEGQQLPGAGQAHTGLAAVLYEWNKLADAAHHLTAGLSLGRELGEMAIFDGYIIQMNLKQAQGDAAGALEVIDQAEQIIEKFSPLAHRVAGANRVRLWLRQANWDAAARWAAADNLASPGEPGDGYHFYEFRQLTLVRVLIAQATMPDFALPGSSNSGNSGPSPTQKALQLLETLYPEAVKLDRGRSVVEILLLQALAHQAAGNFSEAVAALTQALTLAEPEGFVRLFIDEGAPMAELLGRMKDREAGGTLRMKEYIRKLLISFSAGVQGCRGAGEEIDYSPPLPPSPAPLLVEPLSERELEILRLIAAGRSNEEIAQTLVIALGTVKKHINNIYGKLGVHSRTQALVQAKALKLLP